MLDILNIDKLESVEHKVTTLETQVNNTVKTDGDGTKFLTDDGSYKPVEVDLSDYVSSTELDNKLQDYATLNILTAAVNERARAEYVDSMAEYIRTLPTTEIMNEQLANKANKNQIITKTNGDGDKFLADDGTYKTVTSGGGTSTDGITQEQLTSAIATAVEPLATKEEVNTALEDKADKTDIITKTDGGGAQFLADDGTYKAVTSSGTIDLSGYASVTQLNEALALKVDKTEIITKSDGDGTKYLADDGTYKTVQGSGTGDEKTFVAEYNVTTAQEIIAYLDAAKEPFAPMLVKRGTDYYTVTTTAKQDANKIIIRTFATLSGNFYMFTYTVTDGTWASSSHGFQKLLESGTNIKTINGQSLLGSGDVEIQGGGDGISPEQLQAAINPLATKQELTDGLATKADSNQVAEDIAEALGTKVETSVFEAYKAEVTEEFDTKANKSDIITKTDGDGTSFLANDGSYKVITTQGSVDLTSYVTTEAMNAALNLKADKDQIPDTTALATKQEVTDGLSTKVDSEALNAYETSEHAEATFAKKDDIPDVSDLATKQEVTEGLAKKANTEDIPNLTGLVTTSELTTALADKASSADVTALSTKVDNVETTVTDQNDRLVAVEEQLTNSAGTLQIKDLKAGSFKVKVDENGSANVGGTNIRFINALENGKTINGAYLEQILPTSDGATGLKTPKISFAWDDDGQDGISFNTKTFTQDQEETRFVLPTKAYTDGTYATKSEVITITSGDGTQFLANDGTYKSVTMPDVSGFETTTHAAETYATKTALDAKPETTVTRADNTGSWGSESTVTIAQTDGGSLQFVKRTERVGPDTNTTVTLDGVALATTANIPDVSSYLTTTEAADTYATKTSVSQLASTKADRTELEDYATKTELNEKASTGSVQALTSMITQNTGKITTLENDKADRTQLQGYLTKMEASETYETIARASKIKSISSVGHAVTITDEGLANIGGTKVTKTAESPQIGISNASIVVEQTLPATTDDTTGEGYTLPINYTSTTVGANTKISNFTIDGVPVVTKDDLPVVDSTLIPDSPNPVSNAAVVTGFATYGAQIEQLNAQIVANAEAIEGLETTASDYIKQIAWGTTSLTPTNGVVKLPSVTCGVDSATVGDTTTLTSSTEWFVNASVTQTVLQTMSFDKNSTDIAAGEGRNVMLLLQNSNPNISTSVRLVSYKEMQEYIASLDGTNVGF